MPECRINLAHLIAYLSEAPKSTRSYQAYNRAETAAKLDPTAPVPMQVRNAPTGLMKELGYARGYSYNPDYAYAVIVFCYILFLKLPPWMLICFDVICLFIGILFTMIIYHRSSRMMCI